MLFSFSAPSASPAVSSSSGIESSLPKAYRVEGADRAGGRMTYPETLSQRRILQFWWPLASTWMMMSLEGPFIAAVIARLPEPKFNLAAYGVAFAFAMLLESPIILIMSASTALVHDRPSLHKLRRFTYALNMRASPSPWPSSCSPPPSGR